MGMELVTEKCTMLRIQSGKREATEGLRDGKLQIVGNIGSERHQTDMKEKIRVPQKNKKTLKQSGPFLKWTREEHTYTKKWM